MKLADEFIERVCELSESELFSLDELYFAKYYYYSSRDFFSSGGENCVTLKTETYGILQKNSCGVYRDLIRGNDYDIREENIMESQKFDRNVKVSLNDLINVFKKLEEDYQLYATDEICGGSYAEGCGFPFSYRPSKGRDASLKENEEEVQRALHYINWYRRLGFLDKLNMWEDNIPVEKRY